MSEKTQKIEKTTNNSKKMSKKKKFMAIFFPILGAVAITTGVTLGCLYGCHKTPNWQKYFDDPGEKVRHQKASGVGETVLYEFNLKEPIPTGEKVYGDVEVVKYSHNGVEADVTDFELNEGQKKATFTAKITKVPTSIANGTTTYWADIKAEVKCKKTIGDEVVWETTIEDMRVEVEVGDTPTPPEPAYDEVINLAYDGEKGGLISQEVNLVANTKYKIVADFSQWTDKTVPSAYRLDFYKSSYDPISKASFTPSGVIQGDITYEETKDEDYFFKNVNTYYHHQLQYSLFMNVESFDTEVINIYLTIGNTTYNNSLLLLTKCH